MYSAKNFEKARHALDNALSHESLPKRSAISFLRFWMHPSFNPWVSWTVFQDRNEDEWFVRRITWDPTDPDIAAGITTYAAEGRIPEEHARQLHIRLAEIQINVFPLENRIGLDGVRFGIEKVQFANTSSLSWWCSPPKGMEPLAKWLEFASKSVESSLPAATLPLNEIEF